MKPSSSPSDPPAPEAEPLPPPEAEPLPAPGAGPPPPPPVGARPGLLAGLSGTAAVDAELSGAALLRALLDVEGALAEAGADRGIVPPEAARAIVAACRAGRFDPAELGAAAESAGNPVVPLVRALTAAVPPAAEPWVHFGATSQDILDTGLALVIGRATGPMLRDLDAAADAAAGLAARHRDTVLVARTLGQQASPTTFGLKAANWLVGLVDARDRLVAARAGLPVQLGGAAGTLAGYGSAGPAVADRLAGRLGLAASPLPWHTRRQPLLDVAAALGGLLAATGKIALDAGLLAQTEVGEVAEGGEPGRGGSSAMPHKRNPVDAILVGAAARRGPGLLATIFAAAVQEHERAAGAWHAEWEPLLELLHLAGGAAARTARLLAVLRVRPERMRANLDASGGLVLAEAVAARLVPLLGRAAAHDAVARAATAAAPSTADASNGSAAASVPASSTDASNASAAASVSASSTDASTGSAAASRTGPAGGSAFREALLADPAVRDRLDAGELTVDDLDAALDPRRWLGSAGHFVDRALAIHRERRATPGPGAVHAEDAGGTPPAGGRP